LARLYGNENVPRPTLAALGKLGHDAVSSLQAGMANQAIDDAVVLEFARAEGRIVLTNDRDDFRRLHREGANHCGIVEFTNDSDFEALGGRIDAALRDPRAAGRFYASVTKGGHSFR